LDTLRYDREVGLSWDGLWDGLWELIWEIDFDHIVMKLKLKVYNIGIGL
jgi:hypothetical protein